ncbi:MAG: AAA family ATPase [Acidobacteriota bacterium]|nr:AAA family ATPase [Acidobacteriota bacterium]
MTPRVRLAMSSDFLEAYTFLPKPQQRKVRTLITRFTADPTSPGLNYERVQAADNLRSLRIDRSYRAIVLKPKSGNVHLMLWADKHDEAYDWARRHHCRVNPDTGALQIYEPQQSSEAVHKAARPAHIPSQPGPFAALRDRQLRRLGVPEAMLPEIRELDGEASLDAIQERLPVEAYESLFLYLAGDSYEQLIGNREAPDDKVDTDDIAKALERMESRGRFVVVDNEMELEEVLSAPLERWRVFLHPSQRRLVERNWNGPVRVLGGAGTGKTVVAMHRARWLARNLPEGERILFVTFTRNLAADIENNLRSICSPQEMRRIDVTNLDRWVYGFLRRRRYDFRIVYSRGQAPWKEIWQQALALKDLGLNLPDAFYSDELNHVVLAQGITTEAEYLRVPRVGRGTPLRRAQRARVWPVFEEYRLNLSIQGGKEMDDAYRSATSLLADDRGSLAYTAAIVDEAQDMGAQAYRLMRALVPEGSNDLFIVGDGHQRIYGRSRVVLGQCGIRIVGRSHKLRINYRTTEETRSWAVRLLDGRDIDDLNGGLDDQNGFKSLTHGPSPKVFVFDSDEQQTEFIVRWLGDLAGGGESLRSTCIVARTGGERDSIRQAIEEAGLPGVVLERDLPDDAGDDAVRLATMHRVKGLEFDRVIMASVNKGLVPLPKAIKGHADDSAREWAETEERALVYVAATRARKELLVLGHGVASPFLSGNG